jgi:hypothetical protein
MTDISEQHLKEAAAITSQILPKIAIHNKCVVSFSTLCNFQN